MSKKLHLYTQSGIDELLVCIVKCAYKDLYTLSVPECHYKSAVKYFQDNPYGVNEEIMKRIYKKGMNNRWQKLNTLMERKVMDYHTTLEK